MKHRKRITSLFVLLLAWVLLLCMPVSVAAGSTDLTTSVPSNVTLTVEVGGKGTVWVGIHRIRREQTLSVPRNEQTETSLRPDRGYEVASILLDGTDITSQMKNGTLTLDVTGTEHKLSVAFARSNSQYPKPDLPEIKPDHTKPIVWWLQTVKNFFRWMFRKP